VPKSSCVAENLVCGYWYAGSLFPEEYIKQPASKTTRTLFLNSISAVPSAALSFALLLFTAFHGKIAEGGMAQRLANNTIGVRREGDKASREKNVAIEGAYTSGRIAWFRYQ